MTEATAALSEKGPKIYDDVLVGADAIVATWVQMQLGEPPVALPMFTAIAVLPNSEEGIAKVMGQIDRKEPPDFLAGAIFWDHYPKYDIHVTVACADMSAAHPRVIRKVLEYPFGQLNLPRISALIHASNTRCIENAAKMGFELEGTKRGTDLQMWGLERSKCWIWNKVAADAAP